MALSYYTNWETEMNFPAQAETELLQELFNDNFGFFSDTSCNDNIDHLFEPNNDFLYAAENCTPLLPNYLPPPTDHNFNTPLVEFDPFHIQKRQKLYDYDLNPVFPEVVLPDFLSAPPIYNGGSCETATKAPGGGLSAQSIAARQRRRKITEKTQELLKLVPGGQKMNTAEMLQSAHKYIKFLQAQVGILDFMGSSSTFDHHHQVYYVYRFFFI